MLKCLVWQIGLCVSSKYRTPEILVHAFTCSHSVLNTHILRWEVIVHILLCRH